MNPRQRSETKFTAGGGTAMLWSGVDESSSEVGNLMVGEAAEVFIVSQE